MTTNDPFASPPGDPDNAPVATPTPDAAPPPVAPPTPPAPGVLVPDAPGAPSAPLAPTAPGVLVPGATPGLLVPAGAPSAPPAPPVGAFAPMAGPPPVAPTGLATWATVLTGAYAAISLITAALTPMLTERLKDTLADAVAGEQTSPFGDPLSGLLNLVSSAVSIAAFIFLALWMAKIRANRTQLGETPGGPPAVEWWGWFVPLANFVLPLLGMRAISRRLVGWGVLLLWWLPFCAVWLLTPISVSASFRAIDLTTGELTNPGVLDQMVPLAWASAALLVVSWVGLAAIIRKTTAKHLNA